MTRMHRSERFLPPVARTGLSILFLAVTLSAAPALAQDSDDFLRGQVDMALTLSRDLQNAEISTELRDGQVVLTGTVGTEMQVGLASDIATNITGDDGVSVELETDRALAQRARSRQVTVKDAYEQWHEAHVRAELLEAYASSPAMEDYDIQFELEGDVLLLTGHVGTDIEKTIASQQAMRLEEVTRVDNRLEVDNRPDPVTVD